MKKKWKQILTYTSLVKMILRTKDTKHLETMLTHFAPNNSFISYEILIQFFKYRIKVYQEEQEAIQNDALYYTLHDPEALKLVEMNDRIIEEYEWLLEFLENNYQKLTF